MLVFVINVILPFHTFIVADYHSTCLENVGIARSNTLVGRALFCLGVDIFCFSDVEDVRHSGRSSRFGHDSICKVTLYGFLFHFYMLTSQIASHGWHNESLRFVVSSFMSQSNLKYQIFCVFFFLCIMNAGEIFTFNLFNLFASICTKAYSLIHFSHFFSNYYFSKRCK